MGATLALPAACEESVEGLVLWAPCVSGKLYVREMRLLAMASSAGETGVDSASSDLEVAGFTLSAECVDDLAHIDLLDCRKPLTRRALVVGRDDLSEDTRLPDRLRDLGLEVEYRRCGGYLEAMDEPHFNVVPDDVLGTIVEWVGRHTEVAAGAPRRAGAPPAATTTFELSAPSRSRATNAIVEVTEAALRFGPDERLFGVLVRRAEHVPSERLAVLLLNTGSVHHIGVNRTYVTLARRLAVLGVSSLRFDIGGIGDGVAPDVAFENHPYPPNLRGDVGSPLTFLGDVLGYDRFIALGLCSGAYAAFHAALDSDRVVETIMVNPLTFRWEEGMSLNTPPHGHYAHVQQYKQSMLNLSSWRRMLTGQVDVRRVISVGLKQTGQAARWYLVSTRRAFAETLVDGDLNSELRRLSEQGTHLPFVFAKGDPGLDLLMTEAIWMVRRLHRSNAMTLKIIDGADHTFSSRPARRLLIDTVLERIVEQSRRLDEPLYT